MIKYELNGLWTNRSQKGVVNWKGGTTGLSLKKKKLWFSLTFCQGKHRYGMIVENICGSCKDWKNRKEMN